MELKEERNSNIELLRIIAMFCIMLKHCLAWGVYLNDSTPLSMKWFINCTDFIHVFGNYSFILITGFFIFNSKITARKIAVIWLTTLEISIFFGLIFFITKIKTIGFDGVEEFFKSDFSTAAKPIGKKDLFKSFFPVLYRNNWYATTYIVFLFFVPYLQKGMKLMEQKAHKNLIILFVVFGTVIPLWPHQKIFTESNLFYFVMAMAIGSYLQKYDDFKISMKTRIVTTALFLVVFITWKPSVLFLSSKNSFLANHNNFLLSMPYYWMDRFPIFLFTTLVFSTFKDINIKPNKILNTFASTTFGIYLIHENTIFKFYFWHRICKFDEMQTSKNFLPYLILCVTASFITFGLLDLIRQKTIHNLIMKIFDKIYAKKNEKNN